MAEIVAASYPSLDAEVLATYLRNAWEQQDVYLSLCDARRSLDIFSDALRTAQRSDVLDGDNIAQLRRMISDSSARLASCSTAWDETCVAAGLPLPSNEDEWTWCIAESWSGRPIVAMRSYSGDAFALQARHDGSDLRCTCSRTEGARICERVLQIDAFARGDVWHRKVRRDRYQGYACSAAGVSAPLADVIEGLPQITTASQVQS